MPLIEELDIQIKDVEGRIKILRMMELSYIKKRHKLEMELSSLRQNRHYLVTVKDEETGE